MPSLPLRSSPSFGVTVIGRLTRTSWNVPEKGLYDATAAELNVIGFFRSMSINSWTGMMAYSANKKYCAQELSMISSSSAGETSRSGRFLKPGRRLSDSRRFPESCRDSCEEEKAELQSLKRNMLGDFLLK